MDVSNILFWSGQKLHIDVILLNGRITLLSSDWFMQRMISLKAIYVVGKASGLHIELQIQLHCIVAYTNQKIKACYWSHNEWIIIPYNYIQCNANVRWFPCDT